MSLKKKILLSIMWLIAFIAITSVLGSLSIGNSSSEDVGGLVNKTGTLLLISIVGLTPLVMAVLVLFGRPEFLYKSKSSRNNLEKTAKATAKVMLNSFLAIKKKYDYSIETASDKIKIYSHMLRLRPGYTQPIVEEVLEKAQELSTLRGQSKGINLNTLVFIVVIREYTLDTGKALSKEDRDKVQETIDRLYS